MTAFTEHLNRARVEKNGWRMSDADWALFGRVCGCVMAGDISPWSLKVNLSPDEPPCALLLLKDEAQAKFWACEGDICIEGYIECGGEITVFSFGGGGFSTVDEACDCLARLMLNGIDRAIEELVAKMKVAKMKAAEQKAAEAAAGPQPAS